MDALTWHHLLTAAPAPSPAPRSGLPDAARGDYALDVAVWFGVESFDSPLVENLTADMTLRIEANRRSPSGAKEILALDGPFGVGKTSLIRELARRHYPTYAPRIDTGVMPTWTPEPGVTHDHVPIMWVQLQAGSTLKILYTALLDFLRFPLHGTSGLLASRALRAISRAGVQLLVLDDVHKLRETQQASRDIIDALHTINTTVGEAGGTLCLVGSELQRRTLLNHPQIDSRLKQFTLDPFTIGDEMGRRTWQTFLTGVEERCLRYLPEARPGFLARDLPVYLHARTQGHMQDIQQLIKDGLHLALDQGVPTIDRSILDKVRLSQRAQRAEALLRSTPKPTTNVAKKAS